MNPLQSPSKAELAACCDDVAVLVADALVEVESGRGSFAGLHSSLQRVADRLVRLKLDVYPQLLPFVRPEDPNALG